MRRLWFVFLPMLMIQIYLAYFQDDGPPQFRRPPAAQTAPAPQARAPEQVTPRRQTGTVLSPRSNLDPSFTVDVGEKGNSTGTAFSIRDDGIWFTARHVVDGCDRVGLQVDQRRRGTLPPLSVMIFSTSSASVSTWPAEMSWRAISTLS